MITIVRGKKLSDADPILARAQLEMLQNRLKVLGTEEFCANTMWVLRKKPEEGKPVPKNQLNKRLVPFKFNRVQSMFTNTCGKKNDVVKYRQAGFTTYGVNVRLFLPAITELGFASLLVSQTNGYAIQHFNIIKRTHRFFLKADPYNDENPKNLLWQQLQQHMLHTQYSSRKELVFDFLDSRILIDTAENEECGQGLPGLSALWLTEVARWPGDPAATVANVSEAVHHEGTIDKESTPNGLGGYFYEDYMRAKESRDPEFQGHFYPWPFDDEYREKPLEDSTILTEKMSAEQLAEEEEARKAFNLDMEQITWRRRKMIFLGSNEFSEKYPEDDQSCFMLSGRPFFDNHKLKSRKLALTNFKPYLVSDDNATRIFFQRKVNRRYVIGADPASGKLVTEADTDFSAAVVIDEQSGVQVASFMDRLPPEEFAVILAQLGRMYNNAMIAVERIGDGGTVMLQLKHEGYSNIYEHVEWDKMKRQIIKLPGWPPSQITRPIACNRIAQYVRENPEGIHCERFLSHAFTFTRNGKTGKPEGSEGTHDDAVSANYIAYYVRLVNLGYLDPLSDHREAYGFMSTTEGSS